MCIPAHARARYGRLRQFFYFARAYILQSISKPLRFRHAAFLKTDKDLLVPYHLEACVPKTQGFVITLLFHFLSAVF